MTRLTLGDRYGRINRFKYMNSGLFISIEQVLSLADLKLILKFIFFVYLPIFPGNVKKYAKKFFPGSRFDSQNPQSVHPPVTQVPGYLMSFFWPPEEPSTHIGHINTPRQNTNTNKHTQRHTHTHLSMQCGTGEMAQ